MASPVAKKRKSGSVEGNDLLYHFLQKTLLEDDAAQFQALATSLVVSLGIWLPPDVYQRYPILLPYAVRDPKCRGDKRRGLPDAWGSPDGTGRFRDDNSLVKSLAKSLTVANLNNRLLHGKRLGTNFVASHVWRKLSDGSDAPRNWQTYSFVPNLVWLPSQLSKLSDREGGFVQTLLQALSRKIYSPLPQSDELKSLADEAWARLPERPEAAHLPLPEVSTLNFFAFDEAWLARRIKTLRIVTAAVGDTAAGTLLTTKVVASRYAPGLAALGVNATSALAETLSDYLARVDG